MKKQQKKTKTRWHRLLGKLLEELLVPVGISVYTEVPVTVEPPKTDVLLLGREGSEWTAEQAERLPDGIRGSRAKHILLEFKYTESINKNAISQTLCYEFFYRRTQKLDEDEAQIFLISSKTPRKAVLEKAGYYATDQKGVYKSSDFLLEAIPILVLNELSDEMHNAFIKCFASRKKAKKSAFETLTRHGLFSFGRQFKLVMDALMHFWFSMKGDDMKEELTFEKATEIGKLLEKSVLSSLSPKERLKGLKPEERMKGLKPEERMKGLKPEERLEGLKPKERLKGLKPEERMEGLKPEERIAGLSVKEVEACLKKLKKKRSPDN